MEATGLNDKALSALMSRIGPGARIVELRGNTAEGDDRKIPLFNNWPQQGRTTEDAAIVNHITESKGYWWGVNCGLSGVTVIDLDMKEGLNGISALEFLEAENERELPETLTVSTPSGGKHLYFIGNAKTSRGQLDPAIDVRGIGGQAVAPMDDNGYSIEKDVPLALLPEWLFKLCQVGKSELERPDDVEGTIPHNTRNDTLTRWAGVLRGEGLVTDEIDAALQQLNETRCDPPLDSEEVSVIARSIGKREMREARAMAEFDIPEPQDITIHKASNAELSIITPRRWIMGSRLIRGYLSALIAPGGVGKSMLSVIEALSISTGLPLAGAEVHDRCGVWLHSTEDPIDEMQRKIASACAVYGIKPSELPENFIYTSGRTDEGKLMIAVEGNNGRVVPVRAHIDKIEAVIRSHHIGAMWIDPFIRIHAVSENDNTKIDKVVQELQGISDRTDIALTLVHHTPKVGANKDNYRGNMDMARGASSLTSACRVAYTLDTMNEDEGKEFGISAHERWRYLRLDNAKANLSPPGDALWFEKRSFRPPHITAEGNQSVGVLQKVELGDSKEMRRKANMLIDALAADRELPLKKVAEALRDAEEEWCPWKPTNRLGTLGKDVADFIRLYKDNYDFPITIEVIPRGDKKYQVVRLKNSRDSRDENLLE